MLFIRFHRYGEQEHRKILKALHRRISTLVTFPTGFTRGYKYLTPLGLIAKSVFICVICQTCETIFDSPLLVSLGLCAILLFFLYGGQERRAILTRLHRRILASFPNIGRCPMLLLSPLWGMS